MNERIRILKLLEEGKINADEAARLLDALSESTTKKKERPLGFWSSMEVIPDMISSAIGGAFRFDDMDSKLQFSKKKKIEFKGISGDIEITGMDTEMIHIQKDGFAKIKDEGEVLEIKAIGGDVMITTPKNIDLEIQGVSGDLNISDLNGKIEVASVSGDITGKGLSGILKGKFVSGSVDLEYLKVEKIDVRSKTGKIVLRLNENIEAELEVETKHGDINCEFTLKDKIEKDNWLKGVINKPGTKIELRNEYGDIVIKKRT